MGTVRRVAAVVAVRVEVRRPATAFSGAARQRGIRWLIGGIAAVAQVAAVSWWLLVPTADWLAHRGHAARRVTPRASGRVISSAAPALPLARRIGADLCSPMTHRASATAPHCSGRRSVTCLSWLPAWMMVSAAPGPGQINGVSRADHTAAVQSSNPGAARRQW